MCAHMVDNTINIKETLSGAFFIAMYFSSIFVDKECLMKHDLVKNNANALLL